MVSADHPAAGSVGAAGTGCVAGTKHVPLIRWPLVPLLEALLWVGALASVASRGLSLKPPLLSFHLLALIINHDSVIHKCLEVGVGVGHKLKLETIVQSFEEAILLLVIFSYFLRSVV